MPPWASRRLRRLALDLNPIEMMFAKLKTLLRKADERTVETTWRRVGELLKAFSPQECSNYLRAKGRGEG
jgi:transposase